MGLRPPSPPSPVRLQPPAPPLTFLMAIMSVRMLSNMVSNRGMVRRLWTWDGMGWGVREGRGGGGVRGDRHFLATLAITRIQPSSHHCHHRPSRVQATKHPGHHASRPPRTQAIMHPGHQAPRPSCIQAIMQADHHACTPSCKQVIMHPCHHAPGHHTFRSCPERVVVEGDHAR